MRERLRRNLLYYNAAVFGRSAIQPKAMKTIKCSHSDVKFYATTPNTIIYYKSGCENGYFRECRRHLSKYEYLEKLINDYCKYVFVNEYSEECNRILKEKLSSRGNFEKFFNMGAGTAEYSRINKFRKTHNPEYIGIAKPYPKWFEDQLLSLVQFAWGALDDYRYNIITPIGQYNTYNANRTITTKRLADLLQVGEIIPVSEYTYLELDGEVRFGVSVAAAEGIDPDCACIKDLSPSFQRQLVSLNLVDVICYQKDHRPGNYFVTTDKDVVTGLSAFDNDCPTTMIATFNISFTTYAGCSPIITDQGFINRPFLEKKMAKILFKLTREDIQSCLYDSISYLEREAIWQRIKRLRKAIHKSLNTGKVKLLADDEWSRETIQTELSGGFGKTYLKLFADKYICS